LFIETNCAIGYFSPFLRSISGKKSLSFQLESWNLLWQGLFYLVLYFIWRAARKKDFCSCKINPGDRPGFLHNQYFILKSSLWAKTRAEHGNSVTEATQTLLSKNDKIILPKTERQDFMELRLG